MYITTADDTVVSFFRITFLDRYRARAIDITFDLVGFQMIDNHICATGYIQIQFTDRNCLFQLHQAIGVRLNNGLVSGKRTVYHEVGISGNFCGGKPFRIRLYDKLREMIYLRSFESDG